jgi:hypothetical protein
MSAQQNVTKVLIAHYHITEVCEHNHKKKIYIYNIPNYAHKVYV